MFCYLFLNQNTTQKACHTAQNKKVVSKTVTETNSVQKLKLMTHDSMTRVEKRISETESHSVFIVLEYL